MTDSDAKTSEQLREEIEERLRDLIAVGEHPEDVLAFVQRIADRMHYEIWHT